MADVAGLTAALEKEKAAKAEILTKSQAAFKKAKQQIDLLKSKVEETSAELKRERAAKEASELALAEAKRTSHLSGGGGGGAAAAADADAAAALSAENAKLKEQLVALKGAVEKSKTILKQLSDLKPAETFAQVCHPQRTIPLQ